jgi:hypothetical protein
MEMPDDLPEEFARLMQLGMTAGSELSRLAEAHAKIGNLFAGFDRVRAASIFGGLLTVPELHSNTLRLEALVALSLHWASGERKPSEAIIARAFSALGSGWCGQMEDPSEDVFVGSVATPRGNFRILNGIWESPAFWLQRVVNVVETMPQGGGYDELRERMYALLKLSDLVCDRAGHHRNDLGNERNEKSLNRKILSRLNSIEARVRFDAAELEQAGISIEALAAFFLMPEDVPGMLRDSLGHTALERHPIIPRRGQLHLVLPTAVSVAIRHMVIERMEAAGMHEAFLRGLAQEYERTFFTQHVLGMDKLIRIKFQHTKYGCFAGVVTEVDVGRYLNLVFFLDTLEEFSSTGFVHPPPRPDGFADALNQMLLAGATAAEKQDDFREGFALLVSCGVGRALAQPPPKSPGPNWRIEHISAADLETLSGLRGIGPLSLWRIIDAEERVGDLGVQLHNINGLLNFFAWMRKLDGHIVPHGSLPDDFIREGYGAWMVIDQNALRDLRHEFGATIDAHVEQTVQGDWRLVQKSHSQLFEEDLRLPIYYAVEPYPGERGVPSVYLSPTRAWWCEIRVPSATTSWFAGERLKMVTTWIGRAVPVLEQHFPLMPPGPVLWLSQFDGPSDGFEDDGTIRGYPEARAAISVSVEMHARQIRLQVGSDFTRALFNVDNVAERAIVDGLVEGAAQMAGQAPTADERSDLVDQIVGGTHARQSHAFRCIDFRDEVRDSVPNHPVVIDSADDALSRLGLGWRVRDRSRGAWIEGKSDTISFVNALVTWIEDELCEELAKFNRLDLIDVVLINYEAAMRDSLNWRRTAAAVLGVHDDKEATMDTMARHEFELNAVYQASRILVEMAICECPLEGGQKVGELDLARLMTRPALLLHVGGWSDAIRWDVMEPKLRVTPLGDIHANWGFADNVLEPFARAASDARVNDAVEDYASNLQAPKVTPTIAGEFDAAFNSAWFEQTGASIDEFRLFIECMEDLASAQNTAVLITSRSAIMAAESEGRRLSGDTLERVVSFLTSKPRTKWRDLPKGYELRDLHSWRFRRRLSILRLPLIQVDEKDDPTVLVAPGLLRDAFHYMFNSYHRGDFLDQQLSPLMRKWKARISDERGREFTLKVSTRLRELGWETDTEVKMTRLLKRKLDRDYGDVDVLAWNKASGRVLAIECKDLQFRKTPGEIAEQLSDFRGETDAKGKADYLRKHLDRMAVIEQHLADVGKFVGMNGLAKVESHLVFRNPVPMKFALQHMSALVKVNIFDDLASV